MFIKNPGLQNDTNKKSRETAGFFIGKYFR